MGRQGIPSRCMAWPATVTAAPWRPLSRYLTPPSLPTLKPEPRDPHPSPHIPPSPRAAESALLPPLPQLQGTPPPRIHTQSFFSPLCLLFSSSVPSFLCSPEAQLMATTCFYSVRPPTHRETIARVQAVSTGEGSGCGHTAAWTEGFSRTDPSTLLFCGGLHSQRPQSTPREPELCSQALALILRWYREGSYDSS